MSTKGYKCPCCGGNLVFSSEIQKLRCPSCGNGRQEKKTEGKFTPALPVEEMWMRIRLPQLQSVPIVTVR